MTSKHTKAGRRARRRAYHVEVARMAWLRASVARLSKPDAFGLMHDRIHEDHGPVRGARSVKVPREDGAP